MHRTVWYVQAHKTSTNSKKLSEKNVFNVNEVLDVVNDKSCNIPGGQAETRQSAAL